MARTGHVKKMARGGEDGGDAGRYFRLMQSQYVDGVTIRPLRNGDTDTVAAVFARLGDRSREKRFCGAKPRLVDGDPQPAGIARLVRDGAAAEIAFAVADQYQGRGIGSILAGTLAADARAAGITELVATVCGDNPSVVALLKRLGSRLDVSWHGGEREFVVGLEA